MEQRDFTFEEGRKGDRSSAVRSGISTPTRIPLRVEVPRIGASFADEISPHAAEVQTGHMAWTDRYGLYVSGKQRRFFSMMDIGNLASRMCPNSDVEGLRLVADWSAWLLLRDDRWDCDEGQALGEWDRLAEYDRAYLRVMRGDSFAVPPGSPAEGDGLALALADLCDRLREVADRSGMSDPIDGDFLTMMRDFFFGSVRQAAFQLRGVTPPLDEYLELRMVTGGLDILTRVQSVLDAVELPSSDGGASRLWNGLTETSHKICCWHNDLVSLNKELAAGEVHNLVFALLEDTGNDTRTLTEAVDLAVSMLHDEYQVFVALSGEADTSPPFSEDSAWYADMLKERINGIIAWHEWCVRYEQVAR